MVSRYVVDAIVISGLALSTIGFSLLELSTPRVSIIVRRLLMSMALSMPLVGGTALYIKLAFGDPVWNVSYVLQLFGAVLVVACVLLIGQMFGAEIAWRQDESMPNYRKALTTRQAAIAHAVYGFLVMVLLLFGVSSLSRRPIVIVLGLGYILSLVSADAAIGKIAVATGSRLTRVRGIALTLIGIATQFVPPVLDLLNIKVG